MVPSSGKTRGVRIPPGAVQSKIATSWSATRDPERTLRGWLTRRAGQARKAHPGPRRRRWDRHRPGGAWAAPPLRHE
jgi:hypothetical protein